MTSLLLISIFTSLFCCGWRIVTDEGQLLYFLRKPFEKMHHEKEGNNLNMYGRIVYYIGKPLILCITCMSSVWGVITYYIILGNVSIITVFCCVISAFLNNVFYFGYKRHIE